MEEVKEFRHLGYILQKNSGNELQVRDRVKKANVMMKWVWGFGERKLKKDWGWRVKLFDALVKCVLVYGVEIWGYREWREMEGVGGRYIRWMLGVDWNTPGYIVREEGKRNKMRIETGIRAMRYEETIRAGMRGEILKECINERIKDEKENVWSNERMEYMWRCGMSEDEFERIGRKIEMVREREILRYKDKKHITE